MTRLSYRGRILTGLLLMMGLSYPIRGHAEEPGDASVDLDRGLAGDFTAASALPLHIEFGSGKTTVDDLSANGERQLQAAVELLSVPGRPYQNLVIEAHTCGCQSAGEDSSTSLGRAEAVRQHLGRLVSAPNRSFYIKPFFASDLAANGVRRDLSASQCEIDEIHAMDRRVVIRELTAEDLENAARLIPPEATSILAQVSFWYRRDGNGDTFQRLLDESVLRSGDEIRLFMMAAEPVHAYIFHRGSAGDWTCLFPNDQFSMEAPAANPLEPGRKYWLPRFGGGVALDNTPGTEETFVYLSEGADARMERWVADGVPFLIGENAEGTVGLAAPEHATGTALAAGTRTRGGIVHVEPDTAGVDWFARVRFNHAP